MCIQYTRTEKNNKRISRTDDRATRNTHSLTLCVQHNTRLSLHTLSNQGSRFGKEEETRSGSFGFLFFFTSFLQRRLSLLTYLCTERRGDFAQQSLVPTLQLTLLTPQRKHTHTQTRIHEYISQLSTGLVGANTFCILTCYLLCFPHICNRIPTMRCPTFIKT